MMPDRPLRIGIDVRYLSHGLVGGVHMYVSRLVPEMIAAAPDDRFVLYADDKAPLEITPPEGVEVRIMPWRHMASTMWNDLTLARWMARDGVDAAFFPTNHGFGPAGAASVVTIHDAMNMLPLSETLRSRDHTATLRTRAITVYLNLMTTRAARRATRIVTISAYSRDTIAAASGRSAADISVVHSGAPPVVPLTPEAIGAAATAAGLTGPYLLADGLKNPGLLLKATERLDASLRERYRLAFFARHPHVLPELAAAAQAGRATLLVRPTTETLAALYAGATAFVFPSWVEGFGFPLLEAMTYGAPIVASDRGSIPEIAGDAALFVDAEDDAGLADALRRVLASDGEADRLRAAGRARVTQFTWRRSAEQTLEAIRRARSDVEARRR